MTVAQIMDVVDAACGPDIMTKMEALEFLADVRDQVMGRMEALQEEIRNEQGNNTH